MKQRKVTVGVARRWLQCLHHLYVSGLVTNADHDRIARRIKKRIPDGFHLRYIGTSAHGRIVQTAVVLPRRDALKEPQ